MPTHLRIKNLLKLFNLVLLFTVLFNVSYSQEFDLILVRGDLLYDYISIVPYSCKYDIPIYFVKDTIDYNLFKDFYKKYKKILIIGGYEAVSKDIERKLLEIGFYVKRIGYQNRYETSSHVAIELFKKSSRAILVSDDYNLLEVSVIACRLKYPVLIYRNEYVPFSVKLALEKLGVKEILVLGKENMDIKMLKVKRIRLNDIEKRNLDSYFFIPILIFTFIFIIIILLRKIYRRRTIVLTDDEKKIIEVLKTFGELTQDRLPFITGFSKTKISNIVRELEKKNLIKRIPYKKTWKIILKEK